MSERDGLSYRAVPIRVGFSPESARPMGRRETFRFLRRLGERRRTAVRRALARAANRATVRPMTATVEKP